MWGAIFLAFGLVCATLLRLAGYKSGLGDVLVFATLLGVLTMVGTLGYAAINH